MSNPRARSYVVLGGLLVVAAVATRRSEALALAAPLLLLPACSFALHRPGRLRASARLAAERVLVASLVDLEVEISAPGAAEVELRPALPAGLEGRLPVLLAGGERIERTALTATRWGVQRIAEIRAVAHDRAGLFHWETAVAAPPAVRVYPGPETVRRLLRPAATQQAAGATSAAIRGDGIEFADLRAFQPGDVVRRVNWRASARRSELIVNLQHPERSADVILFLDSFTDVAGMGDTSLALAVRAAAGIAQAHLRRRDRVGLIDFGGVLRWLQPGSGPFQAYRILDALIDTEVITSYAWRGLAHVPPRTLPPGAQVLALSPLADERAVEAILDLGRRGRDLAVIELPVRRFAGPPRGQAEDLAGRLFELRAELLRGRIRQLGVALATWEPGRPAESALAALDEFRRRARRRRPA